MPRDDKSALFVGRLSKETRARDLEDIFYKYGKLLRCDVKYGSSMAYGFVEYEDPRDAEDAMARENGRDLLGSRIVVEPSRGPGAGRGGGRGRDDRYMDDRRPGGAARYSGGGGYGGGGSSSGGGRDRERDRGGDRYGDRDRERGGFDRRRSPSPQRYRGRRSPSPRGRRY